MNTSTPNTNADLLAGAFGSALRHAVNIGICILLIPFIITHLGTEDFGLWVLITSSIGILTICDAGLATSTVKFVADCRGRSDIARRNQLVSTVFCLYCVAAIVTAVVAIILCTCFQNIFSIPDSQHAKALIVFVVIAGKQVLTFPLSIFHGVLFGERRIGSINLVKIGSTLCYLLFTWIVLDAGHGIVALASVNLFVFLLEHIAYAWLCRKSIENLNISVRLFDFSSLKKVASFSGYALLANIAVLVLFRLDPIVIKLFLPMTAVALYALALKISEQIMLLVKQFINAFAPAQAEMHRRCGMKEVANTWLDCTRWATAGAALLVIGISICAKDVLLLWVGPEFSTAATILILLLSAVMVGVGQECASSSLAMIGYHRFNSLAVVGGAFLNLALSIIFIQYWGLIGVAIATCISASVVGIGVVIAKMCSVCNVSWTTFFRSTILPWLIPAASQLIITWTLRNAFTPDNLFELALLLLPGMALFAITGWFCLLTPEERHKLSIFFRRLLYFPLLNKFASKALFALNHTTRKTWSNIDLFEPVRHSYMAPCKNYRNYLQQNKTTRSKTPNTPKNRQKTIS